MSIQSLLHSSLTMSFWKYKKIYHGITPPNIVADLERFCKIEKIYLEKLPLLTPWASDPILLPGNNELLFPARIKKRFKSTELTLDFLFTVKHLYNKTGRPFQQSVMGWVLDKSFSKKLLRANCHKAREVPFYFEGGNLIKAQNLKGEKVYLSGACNLLYTLLNAGSIPYYWTLIDKIVERVNITPEETAIFGQDKFEEVDIIDKAWSDKKKKLAVRILYVLLETIKEVMANVIDTPLIHLGEIFESPPDFHLDLYLLPAPGGLLFLQDHQIAWSFLESLKESKNLTLEEIERINRYQQAALCADEEDGEKLNRFEEVLRNSDFTVVRVAGCFYTNGVKKSTAVNFLNAITGIGQEHPFCITNGSSHSIDRFLRENWTEVMQKHGIQNVYFTEEVGADNLARLRGGVRCLVQTLSLQDQEYEFKLEEDENLNSEKVPYFCYSTPALLKEIMKNMDQKILNKE